MTNQPILPTLIDTFDLRSLQEYVRVAEQIRGFADEDVIRKGLLLAEEVCEVLKVLRHATGGSVDATWQSKDLGFELADVLFVLCTIANRCEIDLAAALIAKERANQLRLWAGNP